MTTAPALDLWDRVSAVAPVPGPGLILGAGVLALGLTTVPGLWRRARYLVTIAHEGSHGLAALATGRRLAGIRLHSDTSGLTVSSGPARGPGMAVTAAAGYLGPGLFGLGAAALLGRGHAVGVLWALLGLLALLLVQIRNLFGLVPVLLSAAVLVGVTRWAPDGVQQLIAYVLTWFLLLGAVRAVTDLHRHRRAGRDRAGTSDAATLARLTRLPVPLWVAVLWLATLACLLLGGRLLTGW